MKTKRYICSPLRKRTGNKIEIDEPRLQNLGDIYKVL